MSSTLTLRRLRRAPHLSRLLRYAGVSLFTNLITGLGFLVLVAGFRLPADWVNFAMITALIPVVFVLNRRYVWRTHGRPWRPVEVAPFATFSLAGVVLTTVAVHVATRAVHAWSPGGTATVAELANLAASGALWITQYVVVNSLVWGAPRSAATFLADPDPALWGTATAIAPSADSNFPDGSGVGRQTSWVRERWPVVLALLALLLYLSAAWWMRYVLHYAIGDALSRSADARAIVDSRDPHLAAMGFVWLPFPVLSQAPLTVVLSPLGRADYAGPASTAVCGSIMVYVFGLMCRTLRLSVPSSVTLTALLALNPVVIYYAANGMSEASSFMFYTIACFGLIRWSRSLRSGDLAVIGFGLAGAMLCRYETLLLIPIFAVAAAFCVPPGRRAGRWLMIAITVALPAVVVFFGWLGASQIIVHDAFFWQKALKYEGTPPRGAVWLPARTLPNGVRYSARLVLLLAPGYIPLSLALVCRRRLRTAIIGTAFVAAGAAFPIYVAYGVGTNQSWGDPRYFSPLAIFGAIGGLWLIGSRARSAQRPWLAGVVVCALGSMLASVHFLSNPRIAPIEGEPAVFGRLTGSVRTDSGYNQALVAWKHVDAEIDPLLTGNKTVAVDTSVEFVAPLLTTKPDHFIIDSDRDFQSIMSDPIGRVTYILSENGATANDGSLFQNDIAVTTGGSWKPIGNLFPVGNGATVQLYQWIAATSS